MTLDEQLHVFDELHGRAFEMALDHMASNYTRLVDKARDRLIAGFELFGDRMFSVPHGRLQSEAIEEFADALNYWVAAMWMMEKARP